MFTTTSVYFLMLFLIFWSYCGYLILLVIFATLNKEEVAPEVAEDELPLMALIIPCFNEAETVKNKIENLKQLDYNRERLTVYFVDGMSTDSTRDAITAAISGIPNWQLLVSDRRGKIQQINYALKRIVNGTDIIVNTDADTLLEKDVLLRFSAEFKRSPETAVVGANISPQTRLELERDYWRDHNCMRIIESSVYTASIVVAPCYAYRASLLAQFPDDCIADDIYIAFKANTAGYRVKYARSIRGIETRTPSNFADFFRHKFRKGNAFLAEILRFLYQLPYMTGWWKMIYLTKLLQLAILPWLLPYFILSSISLALSGWGLSQIVIWGLLFLLGFFVVTSYMMKKCVKEYLAEEKPRNYDISPFLVGNLILVLVGITYPFYRQNSCYSKIKL